MGAFPPWVRVGDSGLRVCVFVLAAQAQDLNRYVWLPNHFADWTEADGDRPMQVTQALKTRDATSAANTTIVFATTMVRKSW